VAGKPYFRSNRLLVVDGAVQGIEVSTL
jgi:hypothetical protein